jgi:hypothetical protein
MKYAITVIAAILVTVTLTSAQGLSNETIEHRIKSLRAEKSITLSFDAEAKTSKIMAVSENFSKEDAGRSGILAMNFALGLYYPGDALAKSPESFLLTFWVLTRKPRFAARHDMTAVLRDEMLVIGGARYVAKPRQEMEYLNLEVSRENLAKIAAQSDVRFMLGDEEFTFTRSQMKLMADVLAVTEAR